MPLLMSKLMAGTLSCARPPPGALPGQPGSLLPADVPHTSRGSSPAELAAYAWLAAALRAPAGTPAPPGVPSIEMVPHGLDLGTGVIFGGDATLCSDPCAPLSGPVPQAHWTLHDVVLTQGAPPLKHWADLAGAAAAFAWAYRLAADDAWVATLDAVPIDGAGWSDDALRAAWERQLDYVRSILWCLALGYNLVNVPWYMHPAARHLERVNFAGDVAADEFNHAADYNQGQWYNRAHHDDDPTRLRAILNRGTGTGAGALPLRARRLFNEGEGDPAQTRDHQGRAVAFCQQAGLRLVTMQGEYDPDGNLTNPYLATDVVNTAFCTPCTFGEVRADGQGKRNLKKVGRDLAHHAEAYGGSARYANADDLHDWRAWSYSFEPGDVVVGNPIAVSIPLREYLPWLRDWARTCVEQGPAQVLQQSLHNVAYTNWQWIQSYGGVGGFLSAAAAAPAAVKAAEDVPNAPLAAVSGIVGAVGLASGAVTGGIGALIGGAVALVTGVLAHIPPFDGGPITTTAYDDLGRWKPTFERGSLSGDITQPDGYPRYHAYLLPGFCRPAGADVVAGPIPAEITSPPPTGGSAPYSDAERIALGVMTVTGVGLAGMGLAALVRWLRRRKST
jgi:hypothetical protein